MDFARVSRKPVTTARMSGRFSISAESTCTRVSLARAVVVLRESSSGPRRAVNSCTLPRLAATLGRVSVSMPLRLSNDSFAFGRTSSIMCSILFNDPAMSARLWSLSRSLARDSVICRPSRFRFSFCSAVCTSGMMAWAASPN